MVVIEILHVANCPNHARTVDLVKAVAESLGVPATVREIEIRTLDEARRARFSGSPTVRVEGHDIEPGPRSGDNFGVACRTYRGHGIPPRAWVERAIQAATDTRGG